METMKNAKAVVRTGDLAAAVQWFYIPRPEGTSMLTQFNW